MAQRNLSTEKKIMDLENRFVAANWDGEGVRGTGSLGSIWEECCLQDGLEMGSSCVAMVTVSSCLWWNM